METNGEVEMTPTPTSPQLMTTTPTGISFTSRINDAAICQQEYCGP